MDLNTEELLKLERFKTANLSKKLAEARSTIDEYEAKMFYYENKLLSLRKVFTDFYNRDSGQLSDQGLLKNQFESRKNLRIEGFHSKNLTD